MSPIGSGRRSCRAVIPNVAKSETETNEPIMNTSPWAKLISSMMP